MIQQQEQALLALWRLMDEDERGLFFETFQNITKGRQIKRADFRLIVNDNKKQ